jgi:glutathione peroxidase
VLVVNVASACGFTPQYEQLQQLQEDWSDQGVCVLAFPCNDFGGQEPGQPEAIRVTCDRYDVTFPVMAKVRIKSGDAQSPVYADLQRATGTLPRWNFGKYLIAADGRPVAFFGSSVDPMSPELQTALKQQVDLGR